MKKCLIQTIILGALVLMAANCYANSCCPKHKHQQKVPEAYDGWKLGVQCWSLKNKTMFEAIDTARSLGLNWIEAFPGQTISPDHKKMKFGPGMPADLQKQIQEKLKKASIGIINYGVVGLPNNEEKCREVFEFARSFGIKTLVSEPPEDAFEIIDGLCKEYEIKVAIHNHPKPTRYWNPEKVAGILEKTSPWIGICPDTGHWVRSGLDPVESLKMFEGRIYDIHLKEIKDGKDYPWGQGDNWSEKVLAELHRQNYRGPIIIEYEHHWNEDYIPDLKECISFYRKTAKELQPAEEESCTKKKRKIVNRELESK